MLTGFGIKTSLNNSFVTHFLNTLNPLIQMINLDLVLNLSIEADSIFTRFQQKMNT